MPARNKTRASTQQKTRKISAAFRKHYGTSKWLLPSYVRQFSYLILLFLFYSHLPIGPQPYPVIYVVANPVHGLLDRKISEEHHLLLLFVVVSHIQRIGCQPEKTTLHGGQSRSWSAEQGKENRRKSLAAYPPPPPPTLLVRRK